VHRPGGNSPLRPTPAVPPRPDESGGGASFELKWLGAIFRCRPRCGGTPDRLLGVPAELPASDADDGKKLLRASLRPAKSSFREMRRSPPLLISLPTSPKFSDDVVARDVLARERPWKICLTTTCSTTTCRRRPIDDDLTDDDLTDDDLTGRPDRRRPDRRRPAAFDDRQLATDQRRRSLRLRSRRPWRKPRTP
jgi:hypothetical protein